jgi:ABC-2 type transport system permease protein
MSAQSPVDFRPSPRGGLALVHSTWLSWMQYRSFFFVLAFGWMIPPLIYMFVWSTAALENPISGLTRGDFIAYYLVLILVNQITYSQTNWTVGDSIRDGSLSHLLMRPMPPIFHTLASEIAGKVVYMVFVLPVVGLLALILHPSLTLTLDKSLLFLLSLCLAWALRFFWGYWLALLAFWAARANALLALQDALIFLLGGLVAPYALLPSPLQVLSTWLPFRYMTGFPVELLTAHLSPAELASGLTIQVGWLVVALLLYSIIWRRGLKHFSAVGG